MSATEQVVIQNHQYVTNLYNNLESNDQCTHFANEKTKSWSSRSPNSGKGCKQFISRLGSMISTFPLMLKLEKILPLVLKETGKNGEGSQG